MSTFTPDLTVVVSLKVSCGVGVLGFKLSLQAHPKEAPIFYSWNIIFLIIAALAIASGKIGLG